jgi:hypothetical protein
MPRHVFAAGDVVGVTVSGSSILPKLSVDHCGDGGLARGTVGFLRVEFEVHEHQQNLLLHVFDVVSFESHASGTGGNPFGDGLFGRLFANCDTHDDSSIARVVVSIARQLFEKYRVMYLGSYM